MFPAARLPWRLSSLRVLEHVHEDGLELAEDDGGDLEVALQAVHTLPEVLRQVGHVGPLPHLGEELDETGRTGTDGTVRTSSKGTSRFLTCVGCHARPLT